MQIPYPMAENIDHDCVLFGRVLQNAFVDMENMFELLAEEQEVNIE